MKQCTNSLKLHSGCECVIKVDANNLWETLCNELSLVPSNSAIRTMFHYIGPMRANGLLAFQQWYKFPGILSVEIANLFIHCLVPFPQIRAADSFPVDEWSDGTMCSEVCNISHFSFTDWIDRIRRLRVRFIDPDCGSLHLCLSLEFMVFGSSFAKGFISSLLFVISSFLSVISCLDPGWLSDLFWTTWLNGLSCQLWIWCDGWWNLSDSNGCLFWFSVWSWCWFVGGRCRCLCEAFAQSALITWHPLAWSDGGNRLILMFWQLLIHYDVLRGDEFVTRWYPDLVGFWPVSEATENAIQWMSIKLSSILLWDPDMASQTKYTESPNIRFLAVKSLMGSLPIECSSQSMVPNVIRILVSFGPKAVSHPNILQHSECLFMGGLIVLFSDTILLMGVRCWYLECDALWFEPIPKLLVEEFTTTINLNTFQSTARMCEFNYYTYCGCKHRVVEITSYCQPTLWKAGFTGTLETCQEDVYREAMLNFRVSALQSKKVKAKAKPEEYLWDGLSGFCRKCEEEYKVNNAFLFRSDP